MGAASLILWLPFGVHISDGVLSRPWLVGGSVLAGLLVLLASYRVRDEEIPRIALLSAAFFVATLMHLRLGPTSVHLLLNGLVGVLLGRRAPLAILVGLALQAALLGHGGFWTIGVNACVLSLPALLAGGLFAVLRRLPFTGKQRRAVFWIFGCFIGMFSVLATLILQAIVLRWGGAEEWHAIVSLLFYAHLPLVLLEGVVLGFTVSFLARVKPAMLGESVHSESTSKYAALHGSERLPALLLAILTLALAANPAQAHRPHADYVVRADGKVQVEGWFDPGDDPMKGAKVQVFRPNQRLLVEGCLDDRGTFVFRCSEAESLEVIVSAGAGHRTSFHIPREKLQRGAEAIIVPGETVEDTSERKNHSPSWQESLRDALLGISFLLASGAFLLSWRNARKLRNLHPQS